MRGPLLKILVCLPLVGLTGCSLVLPEISHKPVIRNPFPQLSRIAIAPFFNHSDESTVDGRDFAMAYFSELQMTPGFEVVPIGVVEEAIIANQINLSGAGEARRLAQLLGVDAVVVGAVTDYSPYYPPRCGLRVEWYTANPGYHEIPAGYGLPWNTPAEEYIPDGLVYESQMALARAQMATQAPDCDSGCQTLPAPPRPFSENSGTGNGASKADRRRNPFADDAIKLTQATEELPPGQLLEPTPATSDSTETDDSSPKIPTSESIVASEPIDTTDTLPPNWPCEDCFVPPSPQASRPPCVPYHGPVLKHTRVYSGTDPDFTQALQNYAYFREDARFGGWESYLQRSDDFVRFCCHMHISEMLSARGGSRKTQVVWRWPENR
ncbi:MAG: hypothetical protein GXP24_04595 [Planctomycetes bacterium]|nr:hypothetical protein [Planctomycetota bacterium]